MEKIIYNPIFEEFKSPVGAAEKNKKISVKIKISQEYIINLPLINIKDDSGMDVLSKQMNIVDQSSQYNVYCVDFTISKEGLYWYCFQFSDCYGIHYIGCKPNLEPKLTDFLPNYWQLSVHNKFRGNLNWFKGTIMYQIMVDRFYKGEDLPVKENVKVHENWDDIPNYKAVDGKVLNNDFFGGNLEGVIKKLDYLSSLNVTTIYLNPIFEAFSNHKYDTGNYLKIDSMFGDEKTFIKLCKEAKKRKMNIILDGVFNHTGDDSIYFNKYGNYPDLGAFQSKDSKYYDWFRFNSHPNHYDSWWGFTTLPSVNQDSKDYLDFISGPNGVIEKWLRLGAKGFRLDVIDELNNNIVESISNAVKRVDDENILIGEVWEDASNKIAYGIRKEYFNGKQLDSVMNYPFKEAIISYLRYNTWGKLKNVIRYIINNYPKHVLDSLMNILSTHDTMRILNYFAYVDGEKLSKDEQASYKMSSMEFDEATQKLKLASLLQFTLPGVPCIFYGDEAGIQGFKDPFCRRTYPWNDVNKTISDWYKKITQIRKMSVFIDGSYKEYIINQEIFSFKRYNNSEVILVVVNNSDFSYDLHLDSKYFDLFKNVIIDKSLHIESKTGTILKLEKK